MDKSPILVRFSRILGAMRREAVIRGAPVLEAESATKGDPFKLLVFTMLSARTKDERTLKAVEEIFSLAQDASGILALGQERLERILRPIGFYRAKSRNLIALCSMLEGRPVPSSIEGLSALPGVGRKTANIVLAKAFGHPVVGVDVHVHRICNRLGIVRTRTPEETELALMRIIPEHLIGRINSDMVGFGQTICGPLRPLCADCPIESICPKVGINASFPHRAQPSSSPRSR